LNGEYIGHFAGGQTRVENLDEHFLRDLAAKYEIDADEYIAAAKRSPVTDYESVERAAEFLAELAKALSKIAFEWLQIREQKEVIDRAAKTQLDFMREYAEDAGTNLQPMIAFLQKVAKGEIDATSEEAKTDANGWADMVRQRMASINESVNRSEIGRGELTLREGKYDIRMVADRKLKELKPMCASDDVELTAEVACDVPEILVGDAGRIGDIIGLWIRMARVYNVVHKIHIHIATRRQGYGTYLVIRISDDGTGPDEVATERILNHIRSRRGIEIWENDYRERWVSELGHLLHLLSGTVDMAKDADGVFGITFTIPQLAA
ncbi:MAG: PocR ligand-binding domain-containing protein, partial [Lachnospiraceae bacterium]|nr:PocR ligand-binding domain-containing protein [Lachnospiraceae bacterium]